MSTTRRFLVLALIALLALGALGCEDKMRRACSVLRAGNYVLDKHVFPALDTAIAFVPLPPVWAAGYGVTRIGLGRVLEELEGFCVKADREGGVRWEDVTGLVAQATSLQLDLLKLWRDARERGEVPTEREAVDVEKLVADLEALRVETGYMEAK